MDVLSVQRALNKHGYGVDEDGIEGPQTLGAVKDFQAKQGLVVDGQVGAKTGAHLGLFDTPFVTVKRERPLSPADQVVKSLYSAINRAEMTARPNPDDQWIRTTSVPVKGSTAFGPVQITNSLVQGAIANKELSPESAKFYTDVMEPMYKQFIKHGQNKGKMAGYDKNFDYGGSGYFQGAENRVAYERLAQELIQGRIKEAGGDKLRAAEKWRGKSVNEDKRYFDIIKKELKKK